MQHCWELGIVCSRLAPDGPLAPAQLLAGTGQPVAVQGRTFEDTDVDVSQE
jgi:hypothetical protein